MEMAEFKTYKLSFSKPSRKLSPEEFELLKKYSIELINENEYCLQISSLADLLYLRILFNHPLVVDYNSIEVYDDYRE